MSFFGFSFTFSFVDIISLYLVQFSTRVQFFLKIIFLDIQIVFLQINLSYLYVKVIYLEKPMLTAAFPKFFIIILLTLTTCFLLNCSSRREEPSNVYDRFSSAVLRCISLNPITKSWTYILTNVTFEALLNKGLPNDGVHIFERFSGLNSKSLVQLLYSMAAVANFPIIIIHLTCFLC